MHVQEQLQSTKTLMPNLHRPPDKTRRFRLSCLVCRCELDDCFERVQTSNFLSATVLSCRESNSHLRNGRGTDKTVLSCLAWPCELVLKGKHTYSGQTAGHFSAANLRTQCRECLLLVYAGVANAAATDALCVQRVRAIVTSSASSNCASNSMSNNCLVSTSIFYVNCEQYSVRLQYYFTG